MLQSLYKIYIKQNEFKSEIDNKKSFFSFNSTNIAFQDKHI